MATLANGPLGRAADNRFFVRAALLMVFVVVTGFVVQRAAGRSSFDAPPLLHAHAVVFMGWLALYAAQAVTGATGRRAWHKRLGWIAPGWIAAMLVLGWLVTVAMVQRGHVPFFFRPVQFLIFDPMSLLTFAGLTTAAIRLRRRTDWHRRLHLCGMAMLLGPGLGRLLPMPLLVPYAWEATVVVSLLFPVAAAAADVRRSGRIHPAWHWGIGTIVASTLLIELLTYSAAGTAFYAAVTAGSPGSAVDPLAFASPPGGPLITGRTTGG